MLTGTVNANREARVKLSVRAPDGRQREVEAILDSGFNGSLTLPADIVEALGLPWRTHSRFTLANGRDEHLDIYAANVVWAGVERRVLIEATGNVPLLGMALLEDHEVRFRVVDDGFVQITALRQAPRGAAEDAMRPEQAA